MYMIGVQYRIDTAVPRAPRTVISAREYKTRSIL